MTRWNGLKPCFVCLVLWLAGSVLVCADEVIPADAAPRWWKGNLHTHTLWSDGDDFPEMVAEWYRTRGYHFLALTDHNVLAQGLRWHKESDIRARGGNAVVERYLARFGPAWVESRGEGADREFRLKPLDEFRALVEQRGEFLLIPAEEISDEAEGVPVHINASNLRDALPPVGGATVVEAINNNLRAAEQQAERAGREILAHLNHPNFRYAITAHDIAHAVLERHFEVYNGHPGVNHRGDDLRPGTERMWDIANTIRLVELAGGSPVRHRHRRQPSLSRTRRRSESRSRLDDGPRHAFDARTPRQGFEGGRLLCVQWSHAGRRALRRRRAATGVADPAGW